MDDKMKARVEDLVNRNRVFLLMKGTPAMPQCGFSARVVQILGELGVEYDSCNFFADPELSQAIKEYADWPTTPQLFVDGKLVGGCDIVDEMYRSGELQKTLAG